MGAMVMAVVSVMVFVATEVLPGDVARAVLGQGVTEEGLASIRERLGLGRPAYVRYFEWVGQMLTGDLGVSLATGYEISALIDERFWNTLLLAAYAALFSVPLAVILGLISAIWAETLLDRSISISTLCFISVPEFFSAAMLVYFFAVKFRWFPSLAYVEPDASFGEKLDALALPIMTLSFAVVAHMTRMTRVSVINVLSSPYIEQSILKGASRFRIILCHALPNALAPIINVIALNLAYLISGVIIVETVFNYPGLAQLMVEGVGYRDFPVVQAVGMVFSATYVGLNLLADVLVILTNPRLRHPR